MDNVKLIRLKSGEDIIGNVINADNGYYNIEIPMAVDVEYRGKQAGLVMRHWLPLQLIKNNAVEIADNDIMFFMEPSDDFCEYYMHTVERIHELLQAKDIVNNLSEAEEEEIASILREMEEMRNNGDTLH
jgi:hypothetical protein